MPTLDLAGFAQQMAAMPDELLTMRRLGVNRSALAVTTAIRASIAGGTGGDSRLSGVGRGGARVGARYDVKGAANPTALIRATGPLHLVEYPTRAHEIPRRGGRRRRGRGQRVVVVNGHPYARVHRGPTRGKGLWQRGVATGMPRGVDEFRQAQHRMMVRNFG